MKEWHTYGGPGCGKTTSTAKNISIAAGKYGSDRVMVCSFTRAAAQEIASRDIALPPENAGTLHALCWRSLGRPKIAEANVKAFNTANPNYALADSATSVDEPNDGATRSTRADEYFAQYQLYRARQMPEEMWPIDVRLFAQVWEEWKRCASMLDFNDLIETCLKDVPVAPSDPSVIFVDEAQDLSALQFSLVRKWMERAEQVVFLGDDDQAIYKFSGADADNLLGRLIPEENKIILKQSYRVPRKIHAMANNLVANLTKRQAKDWKPRDAEGEIGTLNSATWQHTDEIMRVLEAEDKAGRSVMLLASCSYMLQPVIKAMRERGVLFHNPFRKTNGIWNPLRTDGGSTYARIKAFLGDGNAITPTWTARDLSLWIDLIDGKGVLKHGAKTEIEKIARDKPNKNLDYHEWITYFSGDPWGFDPPTLEWLVAHLRDARRKVAEYPLNVLRKQKTWADDPKPGITVGTIHSVKGGECDTCLVFPDISRQGFEEWRAGGTRRDDLIRMFYVGITRARHKLLIAKPCSGLSVNLLKFATG